MASNRQGGVKVFSDTVFESLEDKINTFLLGEGDDEDVAKQLTLTPTVFLSAGTFYAIICYQIV